MTEHPTPEGEPGNPRERRSPAHPTRRREQVVPPGREPSERRAPAREASGRYRGPLRRRDDRAEAGVGRLVGETYYGDVRGRPERGLPDDRRSDESIEEEVCQRLTRHPDVDAAEIEVMVEGGEVTLHGSVAQRDARWLIEELVGSVAGVSLVHNRVRVTQR
jgi:hypothetical protein